MRRTYSKLTLGDGAHKHTLRYTSGPCEPIGTQARATALDMLRTIGQSTELLQCGNKFFEALRMYHDGEAWVIELKSTD